MKLRRWLLFLGLASCVASTAEAADAQPLRKRLNVSLGYHYSSGDYGTGDTTEIAYVPLTITADLGDVSLQCVVPYLRISGSGGFVQGPDGPIQTTSGDTYGLGDILARGAYALPHPVSWMPWARLIGRVKFPTASRSEGLGTGEFDYGIETELFWGIGRFSPFVDVGYRFLGSSSEFALHNTVVASAGTSYQLFDPLSVGLLLDYRDAASASTGTRLELVPYASWRLDAHWTVDTYVSAGLADGSPDAGVGLQIGYTFSTSTNTASDE